MMLSEYPNHGTILYIYNPQRLMCATYKYTVEKYINLNYHNDRIDAGLCYTDEQFVLERIEHELKMLESRKNT